jgi:hypothetical protein
MRIVQYYARNVIVPNQPYCLQIFTVSPRRCLLPATRRRHLSLRRSKAGSEQGCQAQDQCEQSQ